MLLSNKVAIITGASRGIGAAAAKLMASRGAKIVVNYFMSEKAALSVVNEIKSNGGDVVAVQADMRNAADINADVPLEIKQQTASMTAVGRIASADDVARTIAFLASDDSAFLTGLSVGVNGGYIMD